MTWIKEHKLTICLFGIIGIMAFFAIPKCTEVTESRYVTPLEIPKTTEVKKPYVKKEVVPNVQIKKKKVYVIKEPALRDSAVKGDIILDVKIVNGGVELTKINSDSTVSTDFIPAPIVLDEGAKEVTIVPEGVQVKEKTKAGKLLQKIAKNGKKVLIVIGGVTVIVVVAVLAGG